MKNYFPLLNTLNYKEMFFRNSYFGSDSFFMSSHFTKIFTYLSIIAAVSNFNYFKLIGWDTANTYLFRVNDRKTRKRCEIRSNLTIKTTARRSGFSIVNFEHISLLFLVFLLFTMNRKMFLV